MGNNPRLFVVLLIFLYVENILSCIYCIYVDFNFVFAFDRMLRVGLVILYMRMVQQLDILVILVMMMEILILGHRVNVLMVM